MKTKLVLLTLLIAVGSISCEKDDEKLTIDPDPNGVNFTSTFSEEYLISRDTKENVAQTIEWNAVDFGFSTDVKYEVQASANVDSTFEGMGSTMDTNFAVKVDQLLDFTKALGIDGDPSTSKVDADGNPVLDENGNPIPNNTGTLYLRMRAYAGNGNANTVEQFSEAKPITVVMIEQEGGDDSCDPIFAVGAGTVDAGWGWGSPVVYTCKDMVYTAHLSLINDAFRFFESEGDWNSGLNYPYFKSAGYTIDPMLVDAQDGDNNFLFEGEPGIYEMTVNENEKTITLKETPTYYLLGDAIPSGWDWADPVVEAPEDTPYIRMITTDFTNGIFRFFTEKDNWGSGLNYLYFEDNGYTIDPQLENAEDGDNNFSFVGTPGEYTLIINSREKTIVLQ